MTFLRSVPVRTGSLAVVLLGGACVLALTSPLTIFAATGPALAQADPASPDPAAKKKKAKADAATAQATPAAPASPAPAPATAQNQTAPAGQAAPGSAADFQVTTQLAAAGVKRCLPAVNDLGRFEMSGVTEYAATTTWNKNEPDKRLVSSVIGQHFGQNSATPMGISGVISAPGAEGKCDAVGLQVLPTAETCGNIQTQVLAKGQILGNLAGVPILKNAQNMRLMLLPSAGNGCVIVALDNYYAD